MDFSNDLPTEAGIELPGAFDDDLEQRDLEQRLARRQGAGPVRPSLVIEPTHALVAQLDRASDFESEGREFESLRARQHLGLQLKGFSPFAFVLFQESRVASYIS
jgi:multidrug efflux pump subunit AcrA (membrane-fusion protein)